MKIVSSLSFIFLAILSGSQSFAMGHHAPSAPLTTVEKVNLVRYLGKWYEIARLEQFFEKGCVGATADYSLADDGKIKVLNTCHMKSCDGKIKVANGIARVVDTLNNSKLKVSFFWPFEGDYWIMKLGQDYEYAVVGSPDRKSMWILSRTPQITDALFAEIKTEFAAKDFDTEALVQTPCNN